MSMLTFQDRANASADHRFRADVFADHRSHEICHVASLRVVLWRFELFLLSFVW